MYAIAHAQAFQQGDVLRATTEEDMLAVVDLDAVGLIRIRPPTEERAVLDQLHAHASVGEVAGGSNGVLKLSSGHGSLSRNCKISSRSSGFKTAKKGELWRSLRAREVVDTKNSRSRSFEYELSGSPG